MTTRKYESELRVEQARLTRRRILDAAERLLLERGYGEMTVAALADAAGVSAQTIYNSVGAKAAVVKALYDVRLAGDDADVPIRDRPEMLAVREASSAAAMVGAYAAVSRVLAERVGPLLGALQDAEGGDELRAFTAAIDEERLRGNSMFVTALDDRFGLAPGLSREHAIDIVWTLTSPAVHRSLVVRRGWTLDEFEAWLGDTLVRQLTGTSRRRR